MTGSGMAASTGKPISGVDHIRQSIADILSTTIGSRVMRRDYGSLLPELIDAPINARTRLRVSAATATAIIKWEPRIRPSQISLEMETDLEKASRIVVALTGTLRNGPMAGDTVDIMVAVSNAN